MTNQEIWQAVLGEMELNLSRANFTTWFKSTFISALEDDKAIVSVPNTFTKAWLEKKYHKDIMQALEKVIQRKITDILYKVELMKQPASNLNNIDGLTAAHGSDKSFSLPPEAGQPAAKDFKTNRFGLNPQYVFDSFIIGKNNQLAHAAAQAVAANLGKAYNPLFIYGGVGLGKTHLLQAIGNEVVKNNDKKPLYVTCEKFTNDYVQAVRTGRAKEFKDLYRNVDLLLIDDIQFMGGKDGTQEEFFHTFNDLHQSSRQIVVSSDRQPKAIQSLEERLKSRFEWGMVVDIIQPDLETRAAILGAKCREKNYALDAEILTYIASVVQSNIRELEGALNRIIAYHQFNQAEPTLDSTKEILSNIINNLPSKSITPKTIIDVVSKFFDIEIVDLTGKSRKKELVVPRQIAMFLMRAEINTSFPTIGNEFGGRDHTTAIHACNKIAGEIKQDQRKKQEIESIKQLLYSF
ncbi:chromosomal replication initiator protein DnaA [Candidatus Falkowbacteria bacterium CG10_big_fil_rev_8_21_14_0_10_43_11]|uniref:Chromosomal replication initiator protein DnaA n=1 Tax=Candidatus Falkowbacteria bacterium CG10_big_fil_rev_8_21_14_0_10_43_11 TaxID=1974568 RepID=A0A2M6WLJ3_9BACT|nr:MAG: chromosomal replication initiator protein DnaA [Candidatus Falkowbacteria bacterium CG10_big_fil_rev_8_21_14_0_10_43_11]